MASPKLSVIMPVYQGAATLGRTLGSLPRGDAGLEVVLVDQGSTDGSVRIAESFAGGLDLRIISAPQNINWMQNTNLGLHEARAPFATFLHQDDLWMPDRLPRLLDLAGRYPNPALWLHGAWFIDANDRQIGTFSPPFGRQERLVPGHEALRRLLVQNTIALPAAMFRRQMVLECGGLDEDLWYTADWDLWLKLARRGDVAWSPSKLAAFRIHRNSLTITGSRDQTEFVRQLQTPVERHLGALSERDAREIRKLAAFSNALNAYLAGRYHAKSGDTLQLLRHFLALGPAGEARVLRDSRIMSRLLPRLRLAARK